MPRRRTGCAASGRPGQPVSIRPPPGGRRRLKHVGPGYRDHFGQRRHVACDVARGEDDAATRDKRQPQLKLGDIEGEGSDCEQAFALSEARRLLHRQQQIDERGVRDLDALWLAGRARGIEHVSERFAVDRGRGEGLFRPITVEHQQRRGAGGNRVFGTRGRPAPAPASRQPSTICARRSGRETRIERQIGSACLGPRRSSLRPSRASDRARGRQAGRARHRSRQAAPRPRLRGHRARHSSSLRRHD